MRYMLIVVLLWVIASLLVLAAGECSRLAVEAVQRAKEEEIRIQIENNLTKVDEL